MPDTKVYISKVKLPGSERVYYIKDSEARDLISALGSPTHFAGVSSTAIVDGASTPTSVGGKDVHAGDIAVYGNKEFIWDGAKWVEFGDLSNLKNLAYHDIQDIVITPGLTKDNVLGEATTFTAAASSVSFDSGAGSDFVTGYNNDAVAPSFSEGQFTPASFENGFVTAGSAAQFSEGAFTPAAFQAGFYSEGTAPSFTEGAFTPASLGTGFYSAGSAPSFSEGAYTPAQIQAGFVTPGSAASFTEGAFTPASLAEGFVTAGTAASYSHSGFSGGSLGEATTSAFATQGVVAAMDSSDSEMLVLSAASTSNAVTAQGTFTAAVYGTDTFNGGSPTVVDVTKFNGGSKAADSFTANTPTAIDTTKFDGGSKAADTFSAGTMASIDVSKFNGGSKAADSFSAGTVTTIDTSKFSGGSKASDTFVANVPTAIDVTKFDGGSKASDTFNAGSAATLATAKALTSAVTGTAAAQTITVSNDDIVSAVTNVAPSASYSN